MVYVVHKFSEGWPSFGGLYSTFDKARYECEAYMKAKADDETPPWYWMQRENVEVEDDVSGEIFLMAVMPGHPPSVSDFCKFSITEAEIDSVDLVV